MTLTARWYSKSSMPILSILKKYGAVAETTLKEELELEAEGILHQSREIVPVDTGALRDSGFIEPAEVQGYSFGFEMGYGGPNAQINPKTGKSTDDYALPVHEDLDVHHPHGTAKYLELPFNQARSGMLNRLAHRLSLAMKGVR